MKFITAEIIFDKINGAVFIFALFSCAIDCAITDKPPNPHKAAAIGNVKRVGLLKDKVFSARVHSNMPYDMLSEMASSLVKRFKNSINGVKILSDISASVKI